MILVINSGSSSLKLSLFLTEEGCPCLLDAHLAGIHSSEPKLTIHSDRGEAKNAVRKMNGIKEYLNFMLNEIADVFGHNLSSIIGIGHRIVHGGEPFVAPTRVDTRIFSELEKISYLAPLHNPACLEALAACMEIFPESIPEIAVFDTAFHQNMPAVASTYAIPRGLSLKYHIKRFGFHGISHASLWQAYASQIEPEAQKHSIITMHLGNGCSMCAIKEGISIDTTMGFTPVEGLVMATRCGDVDPTLIDFLSLHEGLPPSAIAQIFNFSSGLLGISGISSDMKAILDQISENSDAQLAVDLFCYRIIKYLGSYLAILEAANAFIFSGGIGENSFLIREKIIDGMGWMGVKIDPQVNRNLSKLSPGKMHRISSQASIIPVYVCESNENKQIAEQLISYIHNLK